NRHTPESPPPPPAAAAPHKCATPATRKRWSPRPETTAGGTGAGSGDWWLDWLKSLGGPELTNALRPSAYCPLILHDFCRTYPPNMSLPVTYHPRRVTETPKK